MSAWVVVNEGGIHRTSSIVGPFDSMDEAYRYCGEQDKDMSKTSVRSLRDPTE